MDLNLKLV